MLLVKEKIDVKYINIQSRFFFLILAKRRLAVTSGSEMETEKSWLQFFVPITCASALDDLFSFSFCCLILSLGSLTKLIQYYIKISFNVWRKRTKTSRMGVDWGRLEWSCNDEAMTLILMNGKTKKRSHEAGESQDIDHALIDQLPTFP